MSILNQAEVVMVKGLGGNLHVALKSIASVVADSATLIEAVMTRAGYKSVKADKNVKLTKKRKEAICKFKDEFSAALASGAPEWRATIAEALEEADIGVITEKDWRDYLQTQPKSCPRGQLRTLYNCVSSAFKEAGYPVVAERAKEEEEEEEEGEGGEEGDSPESGEITLAELVKFFADRKVSVELAASALTCLAQSAGQSIPASVLAHVAEEDIVAAGEVIISRQDAERMAAVAAA